MGSTGRYGRVNEITKQKIKKQIPKFKNENLESVFFGIWNLISG